MAYDSTLALRVSNLLANSVELDEKKMFGGVGYMLHGNMACGVNKDDLIIRVGPEKYTSALEQPHTRQFDLTGRPMKGWVVVTPEGCESDSDLQAWVQQGVAFALSLPKK